MNTPKRAAEISRDAIARALPYLRLMRLDRPVGTLLLLWPTLAALWLAAGGPPPLPLLLAFVAGTFLARSAGCVINDIADRDVDGRVARTRDRPLPRRQIPLVGAIALLLALGALCAAVAWLLNPLSRLLALGGAAVAVAYPFAKRWTHWPQAALGVAFSWGIPMAFAAARNDLPGEAWLLFAASFAWIVAYDTLYAMVDRDDDIQIGVKSTAILFGNADRAMAGLLQLATLSLLAWLGAQLDLGFAYAASLGAVGGLFAYQQWLIRHRSRDGCFRAFRSNTWVGLAIFAGVVAAHAGRA